MPAAFGLGVIFERGPVVEDPAVIDEVHLAGLEGELRPQRGALDRLDAVSNRPSLRAEFSLEPGQVYFINNRWILHNRTAFEDYPEPERRRHLVRLWLETGNGPNPAS